MIDSTLAKRLSTSLLLTMMAVVPAAGGVVYQIETTDHVGSQKQVQTNDVSIQGTNMRMQILSRMGESEGDLVWRGDKRQMIVINHQDKSYMVIDKETIESMLASMPGGAAEGSDPTMDMMQAQMQEAMKKMEKEMAGLDPQQRAMVEKMLKGTMESTAASKAEASAEFRSTGDKATMEGYPCVRYDVMKGDTKVRELWVTDWSRIEGGQEAWTVLQDMAGFHAEIMEMMNKAAGPAAAFLKMDDSTFADFTKVDGFPVVTKDFEGEGLERESVLKSVTERDLDPDAFEPPKGYRLRTMGP